MNLLAIFSLFLSLSLSLARSLHSVGIVLLLCLLIVRLFTVNFLNFNSVKNTKMICHCVDLLKPYSKNANKKYQTFEIFSVFLFSQNWEFFVCVVFSLSLHFGFFFLIFEWIEDYWRKKKYKFTNTCTSSLSYDIWSSKPSK